MNKLQLIDADTLYYKPLAHPKMLIDGVLSDGLAILAGDSKIGKSWMVLWLCLQISRGEAVWGLPTRKTDVVGSAMAWSVNCSKNSNCSADTFRTAGFRPKSCNSRILSGCATWSTIPPMSTWRIPASMPRSRFWKV